MVRFRLSAAARQLRARSQPFPRALNTAGEIKTVLDESGIGAAEAEPREDLDRHRRGLEKMAALGRVAEVDIDAHPVLVLGRDSPSR